MGNTWFTITLILMLVIVFPAYMKWFNQKCISRANDWASANSLKIVEMHYAWFPPRSFFWTTSRSQAIWRIRVRHLFSSTEQEGYLRIGGYLWGIWGSSQCEVFWD